MERAGVMLSRAAPGVLGKLPWPDSSFLCQPAGGLWLRPCELQGGQAELTHGEIIIRVTKDLSGKVVKINRYRHLGLPAIVKVSWSGLGIFLQENSFEFLQQKNRCIISR